MIGRSIAASDRQAGPRADAPDQEDLAHIILVTKGNGTTALEEALRPVSRLTVLTNINDFLARDLRPDAIVLNLGYFAQIQGRDPGMHVRIARSTRLLLALNQFDLLAGRDLLDRVDGWILCDLSGGKLVEQILLGITGHTLVPAVLLEEGPDALRRQLLPTLLPLELEVLRHLAKGTDNRSIARLVATSENAVKFAVHTLLKKLNCRNRTEGGLFAHRQCDAIAALRNARRDQEKHP
jgi:DNA-binding NarL/FixJ family response regulator